MTFDVIEVPLDKVEVDDAIVPTEELYASISNLGIIHEPIVIKKEDGKYQVVAGRRRVLAAKSKGVQRITVKHLRDEPTVELIAKIILAENYARTNNPLAEAQAIRVLYEEKGWPITGIAKMVGMSKARASKLYGLFRLPPQILSAIEHGDISMSNAFRLETLPHDALNRIVAYYEAHGEIPPRIIDEEIERIKPPKQKRRFTKALDMAKRLPREYQERLIMELRAILEGEDDDN